MGSITSRPTVPSQTQTVFVPQQTTSVTTTTISDPSVEVEGTLSEAREQSLLGRSRGRFGTIQTSFRGLLSTNDQATQRKTLLGE